MGNAGLGVSHRGVSQFDRQATRLRLESLSTEFRRQESLRAHLSEKQSLPEMRR